MFKNRKKKGFTLIELVIVIAIIGILAAIAIPRFTASTEKARNAQIEANARTIASAISTAYAELGDWAKVVDKKDQILTEVGLKDKTTSGNSSAALWTIKSPKKENNIGKLEGDKIIIHYAGDDYVTTISGHIGESVTGGFDFKF